MRRRRHVVSAQKKVEVDSCPNCGGYWLDAGELTAVRKETEAQKQRKRATETKLTRLALQALSKNLAACQEEVQSQPGLAHRLQVMSTSVQTVAASIQR